MTAYECDIISKQSCDITLEDYQSSAVNQLSSVAFFPGVTGTFLILKYNCLQLTLMHQFQEFSDYSFQLPITKFHTKN